ncbi:halocyanin domain-containing protein [Halogeometricum borinquense]|uniref:Halocyanin domain-containing protein n=1 Tax=Halogeometricum borinquense TaxID=60847 RepID=A0A482TAW1_9EURY|nr:halocyanin domain-containing protein [Halogeometricum borinquense]RYJ08153.1 halocyanin domain-containing protein [Halogeometricum borinquense]
MTSASNLSISRRTVLRGAAGAVTAGVAAGTAGTATAQSGEPNYSDWFKNTSNYDSTVDKTGKDTVTITVGATGNGGNFAFGPAAVRVDPGTTVVWKWNGKGGSHNVVAKDGSFKSEMVGETGHTFEQTFEKEGIVKYACTPHEPMGMKGAVVVGSAGDGGNDGSESSGDGRNDGDSGNSGDSENDGDGASAEQASEPEYGDWFTDVSNFDGTVDRTGQNEITVTVGATGNGGNFAFGPAAVRVDPGTTVVWEWNGKGGTHNVAAKEGSFESEMVGETGHTFEHTFEKSGVHRYVCAPHKTMGMKGAVVVGDGGGAGSGSSNNAESTVDDTLTIAGGVGLVGALLAMFAFGSRSKANNRRETGR